MAAGSLEIGSYIIHSDSASSTDSEVSLLLLDEDDSLGFIPSDTQVTTSDFWVSINAASHAAFKTVYEALIDAITGSVGADVTYKEDGDVLFEMLGADWPEITGAFDVSEMGDTSALISFTMTGTRPGAPADGSGTSPEGAQDSPRFQYIRGGGGIGGCIIQIPFGSTTGNSARENALAYATLLRDPANFPTIAPFLNANFRVVDASFTPAQNRAEGEPVPESAWNEAVLTITLGELMSDIPNWPDLVNAAQYVVQPSERQAIDEQALGATGGGDTGVDFVMTGTIVLQTEANTTWDSAATKLATTDIYSRANEVVTKLVTHFKSLYQSFALTQIGNPVIGIDPANGNAGFTVVFTSADILDWQESGVLRNEYTNRQYSRSDDGIDTEYTVDGGPMRSFTHTRTVVSLNTAKPYVMPFKETPTLRIVSTEQPTLVAKVHANNVREITTSGGTSYRWINRTKADGQGNGLPSNVALTYKNVGKGFL